MVFHISTGDSHNKQQKSPSEPNPFDSEGDFC